MSNTAPGGYASFPGVVSVEQATYTLSHGITPGVAHLQVAPQSFDQLKTLNGTLTFYYGDLKIALRDCRVDSSSFQYDRSGLVWRLAIWDRRWRWAFGGMYGSYNNRFQGLFPSAVGTGTQESLDYYTVKTPQELAALCLDQMGEVGYDVTQLPDDGRPEINWAGEPPAQALNALVESLGCRVVLRLDDTVMIARTGVGNMLPPGALESDQIAFNYPKRPDLLRAVCGPTRFQVDFNLEAVGKELDGTWAPVDDLSYRPPNGWGMECPGDFFNVRGWEVPVGTPAPVQDTWKRWAINPRQMARETVWKCYRISMTAADNPALKPLIPGWGGFPGRRIRDRWQVLPVEDVQVEGYYDVNRIFNPFKPWVWGVCQQSDLWGGAAWDPGTGELHLIDQPPWAVQDAFGNSAPGQFVSANFSVNREEGIVVFDEPVFRSEPSPLPGEPEFTLIRPAILKVRLAVSPRDFDTNVPERHYRDLVYPDQVGTAPRILPHDEIQLQVVPEYNADYTVNHLRTTLELVNLECDYTLQAIDREYQVITPQDRRYIGLVPVNPDGAVHQVTWEVGPTGHSTRASRGLEWNPAVRPYRERQMLGRMAWVANNTPRLLSKIRNKG